MKAWLTAIVLCEAAVAALAQPAPAPAAPAPQATAPAPQATGSAARKPNVIVGRRAPALFTCGGVGEDDQKRIKAQAADHDLLLTFASPSGAYVADVQVELARGEKVVAQSTCTGPLMLVDVSPHGPYEIIARSGGREQRKKVVLGPKPMQLSFVWPAS